jgi:aminoglycoside 6'-N-acetyltransferase I
MSHPTRRDRHAKARSTAPRAAATAAVAQSTIRPAVATDLDAVVALACLLWPTELPQDHEDHMRAILHGTPRSTLPLTLFVAERDERVIGFVEVGLRSHADGCDASRPVGFVEGWFVARDHRGQRVGRSLMEAAEQWATSLGCTEMASDTWIDNEPSQRAHQALGFEVVDRSITYRKPLRPSVGRTAGRKANASAPAFTARQGQFLAFIHHYTQLHGRAPAEAEMVRHFRVTPPTVHAMVKTLERRGLISREPGKARSIRLLVARSELPQPRNKVETWTP